MARKHTDITIIDKIIGEKIYSLRLARGLSRQQLAEVIGVTHQQLQKYEKGLNRIAVGRLVLIAKALEEEINYFYEGLDNKEGQLSTTQHQRMCLEVSRNFMKIAPYHQEAVNVLIKALSKQEVA